METTHTGHFDYPKMTCIIGLNLGSFAWVYKLINEMGCMICFCTEKLWKQENVPKKLKKCFNQPLGVQATTFSSSFAIAWKNISRTKYLEKYATGTNSLIDWEPLLYMSQNAIPPTPSLCDVICEYSLTLLYSSIVNCILFVCQKAGYNVDTVIFKK